MIAAMLVALFVTAAFIAEASGQQKQLGIATYSVKGLSSDVEGALKSLQEDGYVVMETSDYNARNRTVFDYSPAEYAELAEKYGLDPRPVQYR
jgi:hypothetical protein